MSLYDWNNTSWNLRENPPRTALLPVGALEQFGPHLPLGTQNYILDVIARGVGAKLLGNTYLLPTCPLGVSLQHRGFAGTVSLSWRTLAAALTDVVGSLLSEGIRRVAVIVGLGGAACTTVMPRENQIVKTAVRRLNYDNPDLDAIWVQPLTVADPPLRTIFDAPEDDVHAGEVVTSIMMHLHPDLVREDRIDHVPSKGQAYVDALPFKSLCPDGVWGHPSAASAEMGERALQAAIDGTVRYIEESFAQLAHIKQRTR
jgi:creatinine amidohydrolase